MTQKKKEEVKNLFSRWAGEDVRWDMGKIFMGFHSSIVVRKQKKPINKYFPPELQRNGGFTNACWRVLTAQETTDIESGGDSFNV